MAGKIKVKQVKSSIGYVRIQRETLKGLGLKKMQQTRILEDTPAIRGLIRKVAHLVTVEEI